MNGFQVLAPGEEVIDRLPFRSLGRPCELLLTDRRLLLQGYTGALPVQLMLPRGPVAAAFPLSRFDSFIIGRGRRTSLLLLSLTLAVAGGVMMIWPWSMYFGLIAFSLAVVAILAWAAWPVTFFSIASEALRFSGHTRQREALVFLERLELASECCRRGLAPEQVRAQVKLSGKLAATEESTPDAPAEN